MCSDGAFSSDLPSLFRQLKTEVFSSFVPGRGSTSRHLIQTLVSSNLSNPDFLSKLARRLFQPESSSLKEEDVGNLTTCDYEIVQDLFLKLKRRHRQPGVKRQCGTVVGSSTQARPSGESCQFQEVIRDLPELDLGLDLTEFVDGGGEEGEMMSEQEQEEEGEFSKENCVVADVRGDSADESILDRFGRSVLQIEGSVLRSHLTGSLGISHDFTERQIVESFVGTMCESFGGVLSNQGRSEDGLFRVVYPSSSSSSGGLLCSTDETTTATRSRSRYFGEFVDGLRMGFGVYVYETSPRSPPCRKNVEDSSSCGSVDELFIGQWQNDKRWGAGVFRHHTGAVLFATHFRDTRFSSEEKGENDVTVWFPNGDIFRGSMNRLFEMRRGKYFSLGSNATFIGEFGFRACFGVVVEGNAILVSSLHHRRIVAESSSFRIAQSDQVEGEICDELRYCEGRKKMTLMSMRRWSLPKETVVQDYVQGVQLHHYTLDASLLLNLIEFGSIEDIRHLLDVRRRFSLPFSVDMLTQVIENAEEWVSPLVFAIQVSRIEVFRFLLGRPEISVNGTSGRRGTGFLFWTTPLAQAVLFEDTDEYFDLLLLRQGIDLGMGQETTTWSLENGEKCTIGCSPANLCFVRGRMDWLSRLYDLGVSLDSVFGRRDFEIAAGLQFPSGSTKWDQAGIKARIVVVRMRWVPARHMLFPQCFRQYVWTLMLVSERVRYFPLEILQEILSYVAVFRF